MNERSKVPGNGWQYDLDGDLHHPEWEYTLDGDYLPKPKSPHTEDSTK